MPPRDAGERVAQRVAERLGAAGPDRDRRDLRQELRAGNPGCRGTVTREVRFVPGDQHGAIADQGQRRAVFGRARVGAIEDQDREVGAARSVARALDAQPLQRIGRLSHAGSIAQTDLKALEPDRLLDGVARGSGQLAHDGALESEERVHETGLTHVRSSDQGHAHALLSTARCGQSREPLAQRRRDGGAPIRRQRSVPSLIHVVRKIDPRFDLGEDWHEAPVQLRHTAGKGAAKGTLRGPRGPLGPRLHERRDRLGLRQIQLPVPEGALGEFAGPGRVRAGRDHGFQNGARKDGASMRGYLDHVLSRVGAGRAKDREQYRVEG